MKTRTVFTKSIKESKSDERKGKKKREGTHHLEVNNFLVKKGGQWRERLFWIQIQNSNLCPHITRTLSSCLTYLCAYICLHLSCLVNSPKVASTFVYASAKPIPQVPDPHSLSVLQPSSSTSWAKVQPFLKEK